MRENKDDRLVLEFFAILSELHRAVFRGLRPLHFTVVESPPRTAPDSLFWFYRSPSENKCGFGYGILRRGLHRHLLKEKYWIQRDRELSKKWFPAKASVRAFLIGVAAHEIRHEVQETLKKRGWFSFENTVRMEPLLYMRAHLKALLDRSEKSDRKFVWSAEFDAHIIQYLALKIYGESGFSVRKLANVIRSCA